MYSLEWIWIAAAVFGATGLGLVASAVIIVLHERWRAPVRASREAYIAACLLDHIAAGAPLPRVKDRHSARAWSCVAAQLAEMLAGVEGDAMRCLAERFAALSPSPWRPRYLSAVGGGALPYMAMDDLHRMADAARAVDRRRALQALFSRGHPDATRTFIRALRDKDAECRSLALAGLADLRVSAAADRMVEMTNDPSWRVRETARRAHRTISQPPQAGPSGVIQWI